MVITYCGKVFSFCLETVRHFDSRLTALEMRVQDLQDHQNQDLIDDLNRELDLIRRDFKASLLCSKGCCDRFQ